MHSGRQVVWGTGPSCPRLGFAPLPEGPWGGSQAVQLVSPQEVGVSSGTHTHAITRGGFQSLTEVPGGSRPPPRTTAPPPSQCPSVGPCLGAPSSSEPGAQLLWPRGGHRGSTLAPGSASPLRDSVAPSPPVQRTRQSRPFGRFTGAARGLPGHASLPRLGLSSCGHCRSQI